MKKLIISFLLLNSINSIAQNNTTYLFSEGINNYVPLNKNNFHFNDSFKCEDCNGEYWDSSSDSTYSINDVFSSYALNNYSIYMYDSKYNKNLYAESPLRTFLEKTTITGRTTRIEWGRLPLRDRGKPDSSSSPVLLSIEGITPNRILKMEYQNAGMIYDTLNTDFVNMQLWFLEKDSSLEIHVGKCKLENYNYGKLMGHKTNEIFIFWLFDNSTPKSAEDSDIYQVLGNPDSIYTVNRYSDNPYFMGVPKEGQYFRFYRRNGIKTSLNDDFKLMANLYPNPSNNTLYIRDLENKGNKYLEIFDLSGKLILSKDFTTQNIDIDISSIISGTYLLKISQNNKQFSQTFIKL